MNKRLDEIEKQSYTKVMHERGGTYMEFDKQKFAELIVLKCAEIAETAEPYQSADLIKQYFGNANDI